MSSVRRTGQRDHRRRCIDRPAEARRGALVAGDVARLDIEGVCSIAKARVVGRARAGHESCAVQSAPEARTGLAREAEGRASRVAESRRMRIDYRRRWGRDVDRECVGRAVARAAGVGLLSPRRVGPFGERRPCFDAVRPGEVRQGDERHDRFPFGGRPCVDLDGHRAGRRRPLFPPVRQRSGVESFVELPSSGRVSVTAGGALMSQL